MKNSKEVIIIAFNTFKSNKKYILWFLLMFILLFCKSFVSFYSRLVDHILLSSLSITFNILSAFFTVAYIRFIWLSLHRLDFSFNKKLFNSYIASVTAFILIYIQLIPISFIVSKIINLDIVASNRLQGLIYYLLYLPIYILYKYSLIIAASISVGGFNNLKLSIGFLKNNWVLSYPFIFLFFLPSFISSIIKIFIFTNIYKSILLGILDTFTIIPFFILTIIFTHLNQIDSDST